MGPEIALEKSAVKIKQYYKQIRSSLYEFLMSPSFSFAGVAVFWSNFALQFFVNSNL